MGKKKVAKQTTETAAKEAQVVEEKRAAQIGKGAKKRIERGRLYLRISYNNTSVTVTDEAGNTVAWMSSGSLGYSGPKRATPFAASKVIEAISEKLERTGPFEIAVFVSGIGSGRDAALRALATQRFEVTSISDITPLPHNGPRPKKARRI